MKKIILEELRNIEKLNSIRILFACESGSRAWGFPSVDSDYDVRFFYVYSIEKYFSIDKPKETIENVGEVLDFSGWELGKMLKLMRSSNSSVFEKLQSSIIYKEENGFKEELWDLGSLYYNPISGLYHYLSLAQNFFEKELRSEKVKLKKYFYALRSVLAAKWIRTKNEIPPLEFNILRKLEKDVEWNLIINEFLKIKKEVNESFKVKKSELLNNFISKEILEGKSFAKTIKTGSKQDSKMLDELFRRWVI